MTFQDLQLIAPLLKAVAEEGYTTPSPIQQKAIPPVLAGRDPVSYTHLDVYKRQEHFTARLLAQIRIVVPIFKPKETEFSLWN